MMDKDNKDTVHTFPEASMDSWKYLGKENRQNKPQAIVQGQSSPRSPSSRVEPVTSFDDLGLSDALLRGIYSMGWERPSHIQALAIKPCLKGGDVIGQAQSGKGKTGCFTIAALHCLDVDDESLQVLMMAPTRELALQTHDHVLVQLAQYMGVKSVCMIGGTSRRRTFDALKNGCQVAVGTPGRTLDMLNRKAISARVLKMLVLDEADEMLGERGFQDSIYDLFGLLPQDVQVLLFSATLPSKVLSVCKQFMRNPTKILVKSEELTLDGLKQYYVNVGDERNKLDILLDLYETFNITQCIIFANRKNTVEWLVESLNAQDFSCSALHGHMAENREQNQLERTRILDEFRSGATRVLVTTDLLARGFDATVSLVINYDLPLQKETYLHRIGRSARYGKKGVSINFVTNNYGDVRKHEELERYYATKIMELPEDVPELS